MSASEAEERAQFTLAMRARGINDLRLLRALERAPRALFMPQRFADISGPRHRAADRMRADFAAALDRRRDDRRARPRAIASASAKSEPELDIAPHCWPNSRARSSRLSGSRRWRSRRRQDQGVRVPNVAALWEDGFEFPAAGERFDRVIVHGLIEPPGEAFRESHCAGRGSGCGHRRARTGRAADRQAGRRPRRRVRGRQISVRRAGYAAARARPRARPLGVIARIRRAGFDNNGHRRFILNLPLTRSAQTASICGCVGVGGSR